MSEPFSPFSRNRIVIVLLGVMGLLACVILAGIGAFAFRIGPFQVAQVPTPTEEATRTPSAAEEATRTPTPTEEVTETPTPTEEVAATQTPTLTPRDTPTSTPTPTETPQPDPVIYTFTADPTTISSGDPSTLSWNCEFAYEGVELDGSGVPCPGSMTVQPEDTITYTLVAHGSLGRMAVAMVTVTVNPPVTHSTGLLNIPQTWCADLDEGTVLCNAADDIKFQAVTATERYVTPRHAATIAIVGTTSVGRYGCATASLSADRIDVNNLPVGTYVCVKTNLGRYSQFRVNAPIGPSPGTLSIGYTTWE